MFDIVKTRAKTFGIDCYIFFISANSGYGHSKPSNILTFRMLLRDNPRSGKYPEYFLRMIKLINIVPCRRRNNCIFYCNLDRFVLYITPPVMQCSPHIILSYLKNINIIFFE
ncbi:hypothetical protein CA262_24090 [Sphingobium sp. GW456-12-10-14-TSB1]|nr:hypothetical protein CA262_24090 [Sphingobium sp. GW456-12-10-14-TSB1]